MAREMKDSGIEWIGEIPAHWELRRLKVIFNERKEKNDPQKTDFILSLGANYGVIPYSEKEGGGNKAKEELTDYRLAYPNDIVMNSMNIISGSVGISRYFGCVSPVYYMLFPREKETSPDYYAHMFQTRAFQRSLLGLGNGILMKESSTGTFNTVRMRIPMEKLGVQLLPVPPVSEQQRIAQYLDQKCSEIGSIIAKTEKTIDEYKALKQSIITEAVTKGVRGKRPMKDSGIEWMPQIPVEWSIIPSKYMFRNSDERRHEHDVMLTASQKYGIISQKDYMAKEKAKIVLANKGVEDWKHVEPYDYIISLRSFQGGLEMSETTGCITWHYIVLKACKPICHKFYKWLFKSEAYIKALQRTCNFIRDGQDLRYSNFIQVPLFEVSISEQQEIADYLDRKCDEIDSLISAKEKLLTELESYKKSVIYEYVTGKKEVPSV